MEIPIKIREKGGNSENLEFERGSFIPRDTAPEPVLTAYEEIPMTTDTKAPRYFDWILRGAIYLAVFLTPLFYIFTTDAINLSKSLLLATLALVALVSWLAKIVAKGEVVWRRQPIVWFVLVFGGLVLLSTFFSAAPWVSFLGDIGRHSFSAATTFAYLIIFIVAVQNLYRRDAWWLTLTMLAAVGLAALVALFQFLGVHLLPGAFTKNSLFTPVGPVFGLALVLAMVLPIVTEFFFETERRWLRAAWGFAGVLMLLVISLINFRAAWITLAIAMLFTVILNFRRQRRLLLPLAILIIALIFWFVPTIPGPRLTNVPTEISPSLRAGLAIVKGSWGEGFKNAVLGSGPEMFPVSYARYKSAALNSTNFWGVNFNGANAEIITHLVNYGFLGTLAWLVFVLGFLLIAFNRLHQSNETTVLKTALLAGWLVVLISKFLYSTPLVAEFFFWLIPVIFLIGSPTHSFSFKFSARGGSALGGKTSSRSATTIFIVLVMLLVLSGVGLYLSIQRWLAERAFTKGITAGSDQVQRITTAVSLNPYEARYWQALAQTLLAEVGDILTISQERQITAEETARIQNLTLQIFQALERAQRLDPQNTARLSELAEVYQATASYVAGASDFAIAGYERAVELEPVNPFLRTRLAQLYLIRDNFFLNRELRESDGVTRAKRQLEKALDLNPNYSNARYFKGFILDREGDRRGALEQFRQVLAFNPGNQSLQIIVRNLESGLPALGPPPPSQPETAPVRGGEAEGLP